MKYLSGRHITLFVAGMTAIVIGSALVFLPNEFSASSGIYLGNNASLLSETRSSGGMILAFGLLIFAGTFLPKFQHTSVMLSTTLYLAYGVSRLVSIWLDGMPSEALILAMMLEWGIGLVSLFFLLRGQEGSQVWEPA